jgi:hypothetical protein
MTPVPMLPQPHTTMWPRRWIGRRPCIRTHCARVSRDARKAMKTPVNTVPNSISAIAIAISSFSVWLGVMSPYPVVVIVDITK